MEKIETIEDLKKLDEFKLSLIATAIYDWYYKKDLRLFIFLKKYNIKIDIKELIKFFLGNKQEHKSNYKKWNKICNKYINEILKKED